MSKLLVLALCFWAAAPSAFSQQVPPPMQWQHSYGGTGNDVLYSVRQTTDGGYVLGGRSVSTPGGTKTAPAYGDHDFWLVRLDPTGHQIWDRAFGGSGFEQLRSLRQTADGGFILAGASESGLDGNKLAASAGASDFWVLKLNSLGNRVWERTYGGSAADTGFVVHQLPLGGYVVGGTSASPISGNKSAAHYGMGDFWLVRLDANGNPLWDRSFGTTGQDELRCILPLPDGGFIIGGSAALGGSGNKQSPNIGGIDFWVIRLDGNGQLVWEKSYGAANREELYSIVPTTDGGFLLGGYSDSPPLADKSVLGFGGVDLWIVRIDANGTRLWDKAFGGDGNDSFEDSFTMESTHDGGFILGTGTGGYSGQGNKSAPNYGGGDMWLVRVDGAGNKLWDQALGGADLDVLNSLQQTADGGFILGGQSSSLPGANKTAPRHGGADYWVIKVGFGEPGSGSAVDYYVAPNGQPTGVGTREKPWDLATAIAPGTPIKGGDTLHLRGGIYAGNYMSYLHGTSNAPVTMRPYRNERVVIDGYPSPWTFPLDIRGEWAIYQGFDVTQSSTWNSGAPTPVGVQCDAPNVRLVNLTIHDAGQGIGFWDGAVNSEVYGCIIYHNGADNQEHGIYTQNDVGTKRIHDNIIFNNSGFGVHAYTSASQVRGFDFQGNIIFNNGSKFHQHRNPNLFVGGYVPTDRLNIVSNFTFTTPGYSHFNVLLSDRNRFTNPNGSVRLLNNKFVGGTAYTGDDFLSIVFSNNLLVADAGRLLRIRPAVGMTFANYAWDANTFYASSPNATTFSDGTSDMDFNTWKAVTGKDVQSSFAAGTPAGPDVNVRPNKYEPGRANIAIYNWGLLSFVPVDLSGVGLVHGQRFEIRNAQNYVVNSRHEFGSAIVAATYDTNQPIVQVPMTTPEAVAVADPGHPGGYVPPTTLPLFGAFVVAPPSDGVPVVATPPISHWKFDESAGLSVLDSSSANHGVLVNGTTRVAGRSGGALEFDGADDYVTVPHNNTLHLGQNMTMSLWFKPKTTLDAQSGRKDMMQKFTSYWLIFNYPYADGRLAFVLNGGAPAVLSTTTVWQADRWYHVAATLNNSSLKIYINGQLEGQLAWTTQPWTTGNAIEFGGNSAQRYFFPGALDEVRLYNVTLNDSEIRSIYLDSSQDNAAPQMSALPDATTNEDAPTAQIPFTISDDLTSPGSLEVTVRSSNPALLPPNNAVITGTGANRFLTLTPYANQHGTAQITVTVTDANGLPVEDTMLLTVVSQNDPPEIAPLSGRTIIQGTGPATTVVMVSDVETPPGSLVVTATSSNPGLIPPAKLSFTGAGEGRTLSFEPAAALTGWSDLTVTVTDAQSATAQATFRVTVNGSNQPPALSTISNQQIDEDGAAGPLAFGVSDAETAATDLILGVFSSDQALLPNANILLGGDAAGRSLIVTPVPQRAGNVTVSYWARDGHGASVTNSFVLTVRSLNDPPSISALEGLSMPENGNSGVVGFTVGDLETPAAGLTVTASSSNPALIPVSGIHLGGSNSNRTVQVTPAANQVGTATITLTVSDGGLTAGTTFLLLVQASEPAHTNLIAHWKFDELSGLQARDAVGTNVGTLLNGASRVVGKVGYGVKFDGVNQVVSVPHSTTVSLQPPMTMALWFKPSQLINSSSGRKDLLQKFVTYWLIFNYPNGDGKLAFVLNAGTPAVKSQTASWDPNRWYHVTATYGGGFMRLYIDGVLEGQTSAVGFITVDDDYSLQFGGNSPQGVFFQGSMDDVRFYNSVLPQTEIAGLVQRGNPPNNPPSIGTLPALTMAEDTTTGPIELQVSDQETPAEFLGVVATSSNPSLFAPAGVTVTRQGNAFTLQLAPQSNASGSATITLTVTDNNSSQATGSFVVTVTPQNDLPSISPVADLQLAEDNSTSLLSFSVSDVETTAGALVVTGESSNPSVVDPAGIVLSGAGSSRTVQVFPRANSSGSSTITLRVRDADGGASTEVFAVNFTAVNDPPTVTGLGQQTVDQDSGITTAPFVLVDPDSMLGSVTVTAFSENSALLPQGSVGITGTGGNRTLRFVPAASQHGSTRVVLYLSDPEGGTNQHPVTVVVRRTNARPTVSALANVNTQEDVLPAAVTFNVGDEFTPLSQLLVTASSSNQELLPNNSLALTGTGLQRSLTMRPTTNAFGSATITLSVTDTDGGTTNATFQLMVAPLNDAPEISAMTAQTIEQGFSTAPISFSISDLETSASALTLSAQSANTALLTTAGIAFGGGGSQRSVILTPQAGATGSSAVSITVSDSGRTATAVFTLTVVATNTFPTIAGPSSVSTDEDVVSGSVMFMVADQETAAGQLTVTAVSLNEAMIPHGNVHVTGSGAQRTLTVLGATNAYGVGQVRVMVTDAKGASASANLQVTIGPVNDTPTVSAIPAQTTGKGQSTDLISFLIADHESAPETLTVTATADNPTLLAAANIILAGTGAGRTLRLTPAAGESGTTTVTVIVSDGVASSSTSFDWLVEDVAPPPSGVVSWWSLNEESGSIALDSVGNNPGNLSLGAVRTPGVSGGGMMFDGRDDHINIPDADSLDFSNAMSFSLWFKPAQFLDRTSQRRDLFTKFTSYWLILNYPSLDGKITYVLNSGAPVVSTSTTSWESNRWYHLAGTYDGSFLRIYVNGQLEGEVSAPGTIARTTYPFQIGGNTQQGQFVAGKMDEVMLFNRALTSAEVSDMFVNAGGGNTLPRLTSLADVSLTNGQWSLPQIFSVADDETPASQLVVTATSSTPSLVPASGLVLASVGAGGTNRSLVITPAAGQTGTAVIEVLVTDANGGKARATFFVIVASPLPPQTIRAELLRTPTGLELGWNSVAGRRYRVQAKSRIETSAWMDMSGDVIATGPRSIRDIPPLEPTKFYQVVEVP